MLRQTATTGLAFTFSNFCRGACCEFSLKVGNRNWISKPHCGSKPEKNFKNTNRFTTFAMAETVVEGGLTYLNQKDAIEVDVDLMGPLGFSVDQLMELAGLSVACSLVSEYPLKTHAKVLVVAGPGNNGGDGLVAARHLTHFGYDVKIAYPKRTKKPLFEGLVTQCECLNIEFVEVDDLKKSPLRKIYNVVIDSMFGFSFKGIPRPPFDVILKMVSPDANPPVIVSVDIPSGWQVETGDESGTGIQPDMLVSLTAPKLCARLFKGAHHYLGGRFVPPAIREKYNLHLPPFPSTSQCVKINTQVESGSEIADMRISYTYSGLEESQMNPSPIDQFNSWFNDAKKCDKIIEANAMTLAGADLSGVPSARVVLLKGVDERGFIFYTNYNSRKGEELIGNGRAALCFYWAPMERQIRIEGIVEKVPDSESDAYFNSRPRGSRIGAWASEQSSVIESREILEERNEKLQEKYADESVPVPRPPHWGGFLVRPLQVEFWQGRPSRLHDRLRYRRDSVDGEYTLERLSP